MDLGMYLAKSTWAVSYAAASFVTLVLSWVAITGTATRNRKINIILCVLSNQLSELPLTIMCTDACFYTWLNLTGTFRTCFRACFELIKGGNRCTFGMLLTFAVYWG